MRFAPVGDSAVCLQWDDLPTTSGHIEETCQILQEYPIPGVIEWVPGLATITFFYSPHQIHYEEVCKAIYTLLADSSKKVHIPRKNRTITIPICYGGEEGPDLEDIAHLHGLTPEEVIHLHVNATYTVHLLGFIPGFPYMKGLPPRIATPRLSSPRQRVPQGSVAIAEEMTGIYPFEISGGWRILGRTPLRLFDTQRESPFLLQWGDHVRFQRIDKEEYQEWGKNCVASSRFKL